MRAVRIVLGLLFVLVGLLVTVAGAVAGFWLVGPDDTVETGEQQLSSKGLAVVTVPHVLDRHGPTLHVTASAADRRPVFVGVGSDLDVTSYLTGSLHGRVVGLSLPVRLETDSVQGASTPLSAPDSLDWWVVKSSGAGSRSITWPMTDGRYGVVVMNADGKAEVDASVNLGVELDGAFETALFVLGGGLALVVSGLALILLGRGRPRRPAQLGPDRARSGPAPGSEVRGSAVRRVSAIASAAAALLVMAGCVAVPEVNTGRSMSRQAVTPEAGVAVIKHYNEVNNQANRARDGKLSETIEADSVLDSTLAGFAVDRALDPVDRVKAEPFVYVVLKIGAPQFDAYPMRFVATSGVSTDKTVRHLGVWQRRDAGSPWLMTYSAYPSAGTPLPSLDGLRSPTKADWNRLAVPPKSASEALAQYFGDGPKSAKAAAFSASVDTTRFLAEHAKEKLQDTNRPYISAVSDTFRIARDPLMFVTGSGEALVFVTLTNRYVEQIKRGSSAWWATGEVLAFSNKIRFTEALTQDVQYQVAFVIPPKGRIRILSVDGQLVDAGGY
ncbi:hypothetical protein ABZX12_41245 [Kribbella sp. NPDC003505]|uniref:hypothetical protein n=1 Tax=Kribbella sp. NPDC003505 TaxID=3154448 RepID=UPI0033A3F2C4